MVRPIPLTDRWRAGRAYSLVELLIVITIIGILAGIGIPMLTGLLGSSKQSIAEKNLADLNDAVLKFNESNWELVLTAQPSVADDELAVLKSLQYRNTNAGAIPSPGSPYLSPQLQFTTSSDTNTFRAIWNGRMFDMVPLGNTGVGVDLMKLTDGGTPATFGEGYKPVGAP